MTTTNSSSPLAFHNNNNNNRHRSSFWVILLGSVTILYVVVQVLLMVWNSSSNNNNNNNPMGVRFRLSCYTEEEDVNNNNNNNNHNYYNVINDASCILKSKKSSSSSSWSSSSINSISSTPKYDATEIQRQQNIHNNTSNDVLAQLSIRDYIIQRYASPTDNNKIQKQREVYIQNLEYAYANSTSVMLYRPYRFPSITERVKVYMSNWYIPPCSSSSNAQIPYYYTITPSGKVILRIKELSLVQKQRDIMIDDEIIIPDRQQRIFEINSNFDLKNEEEALDEVHYMDRYTFSTECKHIYCKDMMSYLVPSFDRILQNNTGNIVMNDPNIPLLFQFGDMFETRATMRYKKKNTNREHILYPRIPVLQKVRTSKTEIGLQYETDDSQQSCYKEGKRRTTTKSNGFHFSYPRDTMQMEPIIFKFKTFRHYGKIYTGAVINAESTTWENKKNIAIFRGAMTGSYTNGMKTVEVLELSILERCKLLPRCWFTYTNAFSTLIDAKLTEPFYPNKPIPRIIEPPSNLTGRSSFSGGLYTEPVNLYGNRMSMEELLQYKALIMLEGNDISSGLKWALFSSSIVMMPEPTLTSWSMEEKLQPWVHYVPITVHQSSNDDGQRIVTDAEEKMQWILDNDEKAREIVKASTLYMADLVLHPDEIEDERIISDEIAWRYLSHFVHTPE